jgi:hypothetical protein
VKRFLAALFVALFAFPAGAPAGPDLAPYRPEPAHPAQQAAPARRSSDFDWADAATGAAVATASLSFALTRWAASSAASRRAA